MTIVEVSGVCGGDAERSRDWRELAEPVTPGARVFGGTSWTWRLRGWFDFAGGGRTKMNVWDGVVNVVDVSGTDGLMKRRTSFALLSFLSFFFTPDSSTRPGIASDCLASSSSEGSPWKEDVCCLSELR